VSIEAPAATLHQIEIKQHLFCNFGYPLIAC
jgi:hypothetical protein